MAVQEVGIVGCGVMGSEIAQVVLRSGYDVVVREPDQTLLDNGLARVKTAFEKLVEKEAITSEDMEKALSRMLGTISLDGLTNSDLIIEAIFEEMEIKLELFKALDALCKKSTIFASNTSSLSITQMAGATSRIERFVGMHFFNPVSVMPLVEVVKTVSTHSEVLQTVMDFAKTLGKVPIIAKDNAGFIVNLLLTPFLLDAMRTAANGVASIQDIDNGMKLGLNHPMGPLMLSDFIGLDVIYKASNTMFEEYRDKRYAPPPILRQMVMLGHLGQKSKKGFYDWTNPKNPKATDFNI